MSATQVHLGRKWSLTNSRSRKCCVICNVAHTQQHLRACPCCNGLMAWKCSSTATLPGIEGSLFCDECAAEDNN